MNVESFYVLSRRSTGAVGDTQFVHAGRPYTGDAPTCSACGGYVGMLEWLPPYDVELECWDRQFGQLAFGPAGDDILVSAQFRVLYEQAGLTGLAGFEPVRVRRVKRHRRFNGDPPAYFRATLARSQAAVDTQRSGIQWKGEKRPCPVCRVGGDVARYERVVLEEGTWSGEDVFVPRGLSLYLASQRFKDFCTTQRITNAVLIPAEAYWEDSYPAENLEKAREIMSQPVGGPILEKLKRDGTVLRYDTRTNYLVAAEPDGTVRWIDQPFGGLDGSVTWNRP